MPQFKPKIIFYCCEWNPYIAADNAGAAQLQYPANVKINKLNCAGRITPKLILNAFENECDGVMIGACGKGECHYVSGNETAVDVVRETKELLKVSGINPQRLDIDLFTEISGEYFVSAITQFYDRISQLGSLAEKEAA
jgi:F420-non-reducing hydrogenase iron-sulfur subunit